MQTQQMKNPNGCSRQGLELVNETQFKGNVTMNMLALNASIAQTMSSRDIAELTGKRHDHVMADIRKMLSDLNLHAPEFSGVYKDQQLIERPCFNLPKRETLILVSGYSVAMRAKIIDRWQELEAQTAKPIDPMVALSDPNALRGLLLGYSEKVIALETKVTAMTADVQAFDRIAKADGLFCITDAAKMLGIRPKDLKDWLTANGWIYKRAGSSNWLGYSDKEKSGYVDHKYYEATRPDGTTKPTARVVITPKGLQKLAKVFAAGGEA